jgi:hypothetical protein
VQMQTHPCGMTSMEVTCRCGQATQAQTPVDLALNDQMCLRRCHAVAQAVCELLSTAGAELERTAKGKARLDAAFRQLERLAGNSRVYPARIRFVVRDLLELRAQRWVARRETFTVRGGGRGRVEVGVDAWRRLSAGQGRGGQPWPRRTLPLHAELQVPSSSPTCHHGTRSQTSAHAEGLQVTVVSGSLTRAARSLCRPRSWTTSAPRRRLSWALWTSPLPGWTSCRARCPAWRPSDRRRLSSSRVGWRARAGRWGGCVCGWQAAASALSAA